MHCLNIVRCMIVYLDCINIMRFQKKKLLFSILNIVFRLFLLPSVLLLGES